MKILVVFHVFLLNDAISNFVKSYFAANQHINQIDDLKRAQEFLSRVKLFKSQMYHWYGITNIELKIEIKYQQERHLFVFYFSQNFISSLYGTVVAAKMYQRKKPEWEQLQVGSQLF